MGIYTYASSLGRNADRTNPVPSCTGFPAPELSSVSVELVVWRCHVYGLGLTAPLSAYVPISRARVVFMIVLIVSTQLYFGRNQCPLWPGNNPSRPPRRLLENLVRICTRRRWWSVRAGRRCRAGLDCVLVRVRILQVAGRNCNVELGQCIELED